MDDYKNEYDTPPEEKKRHKGLWIFLSILLIALLAFGGLFVYNHIIKPRTVTSQPYIAQLNVVGTIESASSSSIVDVFETRTYSQSYIINKLKALEKDDHCKALILYFNTPGGSVYATDEVYLKIKEFKEKTNRPVYAIMGPTCASGGYYIACAADKIFANRNTTTGSIGVTMGSMFDISGLLAEHGIKVNTITSGPNKSMGSDYLPMTDEQRQIYQSVVDEAYAQFTSIVCEGRNIAPENVWEVADGRIFTAQQALDNGLIDRIAPYDEAIALIKNEVGTKTVCEFAYVKKFSLRELIFGTAHEIATAVKTGGDDDLALAIRLAEEQSCEPYYIMN